MQVVTGESMKLIKCSKNQILPEGTFSLILSLFFFDFFTVGLTTSTLSGGSIQKNFVQVCKKTVYQEIINLNIL